MSAQQLLNLLEEWVASGATLFVQAQLLSVDMNCDVAITSFSDPECQTVSTTTTTEVISTQETSSHSQETIIIGIVLGVLLILVLSIGTVVVMLLLRRSRRANVDLQAVTSQE